MAHRNETCVRLTPQSQQSSLLHPGYGSQLGHPVSPGRLHLVHNSALGLRRCHSAEDQASTTTLLLLRTWDGGVPSSNASDWSPLHTCFSELAAGVHPPLKPQSCKHHPRSPMHSLSELGSRMLSHSSQLGFKKGVGHSLEQFLIIVFLPLPKLDSWCGRVKVLSYSLDCIIPQGESGRQKGTHSPFPIWGIHSPFPAGLCHTAFLFSFFLDFKAASHFFAELPSSFLNTAFK